MSWIDELKLEEALKKVIRDQRTGNDFILFLEEKPHLTNKFCWFLLASVKHEKRLRHYILGMLVRYIKDKKKNIYAWQEMIILDTLRQLIIPDDKDQLKIIRKLKPKHILSICQKNLILGKFGNSDDIEEIANQIKDNKYDDEQIRSASISIQQLNRTIKREIYDDYIKKPYIKEYVSGVRSNKYYGFMFELQEERLEESESAYPF